MEVNQGEITNGFEQAKHVDLVCVNIRYSRIQMKAGIVWKAERIKTDVSVPVFFKAMLLNNLIKHGSS